MSNRRFSILYDVDPTMEGKTLGSEPRVQKRTVVLATNDKMQIISSKRIQI